jgi:hypothetical protein
MITLVWSTEAIIFFFSAFEPLHEELDWTLYILNCGKTIPMKWKNTGRPYSGREALYWNALRTRLSARAVSRRGF